MWRGAFGVQKMHPFGPPGRAARLRTAELELRPPGFVPGGCSGRAARRSGGPDLELAMAPRLGRRHDRAGLLSKVSRRALDRVAVAQRRSPEISGRVSRG